MTLEYLVIFEPGADGGWSAYVPDLPGCVAVGHSLREVKRLIREAIDLHLEGFRADGLPIPKPSTVVASIAVRNRIAPTKRPVGQRKTKVSGR